MDFSKIFSQLNYKLEKTDSAITLRYGDYLYTIPLNSRYWSITHNKKTKTFSSSHKIDIKNDIIYFPFQSLITFLDYSIHQRWFKNEILLLSI